MSDPVWYRSFYWRIATGFVLFLAVTLALQAAAVLWLLVQSSEREGTDSPPAVAQDVAADLGDELDREPASDLEHLVIERLRTSPLPFFVLTVDERVVTGHAPPPSDPLLRFARQRLDQFSRPGGPGRRQRGPRVVGMAPIVSLGRVAGLVVTLPVSPFRTVLSRHGPGLALVMLLLVAAGTAAASLFVFRPARRRLGELEDAARQLGAGALSVRAPEKGGDEIAVLARTFNRMAADLSARIAAAEEADRARRQLLADVSHELMTPLTSIRGYIETLGMREVKLDEDARQRYLAIVSRETERLERIVGDLVDLGRLEGGGMTLKKETVDVRALFTSLVARHEREAATSGVELVAGVQPDAEGVVGDPARLDQALENLLTNAFRHTPRGGRIALSAGRNRDGHVYIRVRDTGEGIPPEHLAHVFDRFYRVDASRGARAGGSGLGLSIVKAIIEKHGGTVNVHSTLGTGTTFEVVL